MAKKSKNWNLRINQQTNITNFLITELKIDLPSDVVQMSETISKQYNGTEISSEENLREQKRLIIKQGYMDQLVNNSHLEIQFENMNISFDPMNLVPFYNFGTVYPNIRVTDNWGILTVTMGALINANWTKISVSQPTDISKHKMVGKGWSLEINHGYIVQFDAASKNYVLVNAGVEGL